jgi:farnesyl diphosphate synthase
MTASPEALAAELALHRDFIQGALDAVLPQADGHEARVSEAMRYAALGGGKRLRAFMAMESGRLFGVERAVMGRVAAAIECLHAYSLVHDDLPAMDNDAVRHGKPTTHLAFDEATAILAGDGLLTLAFAILAAPETHADPHIRVELVSRLALASGAHGMIGGQMIDMMAQRHELTLPEITRLQRLKTGALIEFSAEAGAIMGRARREARHALHGYAQDLGLAFQIADDLLDVEGDPAAMGKAARKDATAGKATFVTLLGVDRAREQAQRLAAQAVQHLEMFDEKADLLRGLAHFVVARRN